MNEYVPILWELAKKRISIFPLLLLPVFYFFIHKYTNQSFREIVNNRVFLSIIGMIFIIMSVLDFLKYHQRCLSTLWGGLFFCTGIFFLLLMVFKHNTYSIKIGAGIISIGLLIIIIGITLIINKSLYRDRLIVGVARFTTISESAINDSYNLQHRIEKELIRKTLSGSPIKIVHIDNYVPYGVNKTIRERKAISICERDVNILLWGDIRKDEDEIYIEPQITIINNLATHKILDQEILPYQSVEPTKLVFKKRVSTEISDLITLIYGLSYFKVGDYDKAINILHNDDSNVNRLYLGLCHYNKSSLVKDPLEELQMSISINEEVIKSDSPIYHAMVARINIANSKSDIAIYGLPEHSLALLTESIEYYQESKVYFENTDLSYYKGLIENNMGVALLRKAKLLDRQNAKRYLEQSLHALEESLKYRDKEQLQDDWAETKSNIGTVYQHLALSSEVDSSIKYLKISLGYYKEALEMYRKKSDPIKWANTNFYLASAYQLIGERTGNKPESKENLERSIELYDQSLTIFQKSLYPVLWANTRNSLAITNRIYGSKFEDIERITESIKLLNELIEVYSEKEFPIQWARAKNNLGNSYKELGILSHDNNYFERSIKEYNESLKVRLKHSLMDAASTSVNIAVVYHYFLNEPLKAIEYYEKAIMYDSNIWFAQYNIALLIHDNMSNPEKEVHHLKKALELNPNHKECINNLAILYHHKLKMPAEARKCYEQLIALDPNNANIQNDYAWLLEKEFKDYKEARIHYLIALKIDPNLTVAQNNLYFLDKNHFRSE